MVAIASRYKAVMHLLIRGIALAVVLWMVLPWPTECHAAQRKRPNIVLIMTDDQGYGDLGCHGNKVLQTPNIDRLYRESVRFVNFHVDPTCSPTRSALMTGRYSRRVGVWHTIMGRSLLRGEEITIAELLKAAGYVTAIFGKWHLGDNYPMRPQDQGFDEVFVHGGGGVGQTPDYWGNDYFDDTYFHNGVAKKVKGYCTDVWCDAAKNFIQKNRDRPFFVYLPTNAAHGPYLVAEKYRKMYEGKKNVPNAAFYGMITNIDENVGKLRAFLRDLGLERDTIFIFMTDNGTAAGWLRGRGYNAGMRGTKGSEYDGGHRVPCFVYWPGGGIQGGRDVTQLAAHFDLVPTLLDLCGVPPPAKHRFDGTSLAGLLTGRIKQLPERTLIVESQRIEFPKKWRKCAVMTERWRLVNGTELYDIQADPGQKRDVATHHPDVVKKLRAAYLEWWDDVSRGDERYATITLGHAAEPLARLTGHDWHSPSPPWHQNHIRRGVKANGFWSVRIAKAGRYAIELRRWPMESPRAINDGPGIKAVQAKIRILGIEQTMPVEPAAESVTFTVMLPAKAGRLQTWLIGKNGNSRGAYYAYVRRIGD